MGGSDSKPRAPSPPRCPPSPPRPKCIPVNKSVEADSGSNVTLKCRLENCIGTKVIWKLESGLEIQGKEEDTKYSVRTAGGTSSLTIHMVTRNDEGFYYCTTTESKEKAGICVKVRPSVTSKVKRITAVKNSPVVISCDIRDADECKWLFQGKVNDGKEIIIKTPSRKYSIDDEFSLTINNPTEEDEGDYTCVVTNTHNDLSAKSEPFSLDVFSPTEFEWTEEEKAAIQKKIEEAPFSVDNAGIVLYGHAGAGKSSFINSISTAMMGSITTTSPQAKEDEGSVTDQIGYYEVDGLPVILCDVPGYHSQHSYAVEDFVCGVVLNKITRGTELTDLETRHDMAVQENDERNHNRIWIVAYVISSMDVELLEKEDVERVKELHSKIRRLGSDVVAVVTKIDKLDQEADVSKIYGGSRLHDVKTSLRNKIGIDLINTFPVANYSEQTKPSLEMDLVLLHTVRDLLDKLESMRNYRKALGKQ